MKNGALDNFSSLPPCPLRPWKSGVAPANQTKESEVRELSGKESGTGSGTPFCFIQNQKLRGGSGTHSGLLPGKVTNLTFLWFGFAGNYSWEKRKFYSYCRLAFSERERERAFDRGHARQLKLPQVMNRCLLRPWWRPVRWEAPMPAQAKVPTWDDST